MCACTHTLLHSSVLFLSLAYGVWGFFALTSFSLMVKLVISAVVFATLDVMVLWLGSLIAADSLFKGIQRQVSLIPRQPW